MSTEFGANVFEFGDSAGRGEWEIGHYRQHLRYQVVLASLANPIVIPDFPIMRIGENKNEVRVWLDTHENLHTLLRGFANVNGINLSQVDLSDPNEFYQWMDSHNLEHAILDAIFGVA